MKPEDVRGYASIDRSIRRRMVQLHLSEELLCGIAKWGPGKSITIVAADNDIPSDAVTLDVSYNLHTRSMVLIFAHDSFAEIPENGSIPFAQGPWFNQKHDPKDDLVFDKAKHRWRRPEAAKNEPLEESGICADCGATADDPESEQVNCTCKYCSYFRDVIAAKNQNNIGESVCYNENDNEWQSRDGGPCDSFIGYVESCIKSDKSCLVWVLERSGLRPAEMYAIPTSIAKPIPISPEYPYGGFLVHSYCPGLLGSYGGSTSFDNRDLIHCRRSGKSLTDLRRSLKAYSYRYTNFKMTAMKEQADQYNAIVAAIDRAKEKHLDLDRTPAVGKYVVDCVDPDSQEFARVDRELNERYTPRRINFREFL